MAAKSSPALELDLSVGGIALCPPGSGVPPRVIEDFELVWVVEGEATWTCDGVAHPAPPDTVILVRPGMRHEFRWDPARPSRVVYLHFEVLRGVEALPPLADWPSLVQLDRDDVAQPLFRQIVRLSEEQPADWETVAHSAACHLLHSLVTATHDLGPDRGVDLPLAIERALIYVSEEWDSRQQCARIPLEALCSAAAMSPRHLSRLFRETFGAGPGETLRLARLEIAADLLRHTDLTLERIAHYTGFANAFHLSRAFRSVHGEPPGSFRGRSGPRPRPPAASAQARRLVGRLLPRSLV